MEVAGLSGGGRPGGGCAGKAKSGKGRVRVKRETLEAVLDQCQQTLELLTTTGCVQDDDQREDGATVEGGDPQQNTACRGSSPSHDGEADMLCSLLKSRVECPAFLEKLEKRDVPALQNFAEERHSWVVIGEKDAWEGGKIGPNEEEFVLVGQDDIADGIASFMAAYLLSLKETKDLSPNQLQDALSKTFSSKKKKGKLRKAWDGSVVVYNVASWSATAIGIYQNPTILKAAFWTSCRVISKLF